MRSDTTFQSVLVCAVLICSASFVVLAAGCSAAGPFRPGRVADADPEFRGIFVATAYNLDWPSRPGLHPRVLTDEIRAIVHRAKELNCNIIILQVRAFGDRIHRDTKLLPQPEPWSAALTTDPTQDPFKDTDPSYDPLAVWITECHDAKIKLHAWVNPFRIRTPVPDGHGGFLPVVASSDLNTLYLDPSQTVVQDYVLAVVQNLIEYKSTTPSDKLAVRRMAFGTGNDDEDIDGVLFDHNLPPDALAVATSRPIALRASKSLTKHQARIDWVTRQHPATAQASVTMDEFIGKVSTMVTGKGLKFGISPLCGNDKAKAQAARWMNDPNIRISYIIPELYFRDGESALDFAGELTQWLDLVPANSADPPIIVAGLYTNKIQDPGKKSNDPWPPEVIESQVLKAKITQGANKQKATGQAHYSWSGLRSSAQGGPSDPTKNIGDRLKKNPFYDKHAPDPWDKRVPCEEHGGHSQR